MKLMIQHLRVLGGRGWFGRWKMKIPIVWDRGSCKGDVGRAVRAVVRGISINWDVERVV